MAREDKPRRLFMRASSPCISKECAGNTAKRRLLVNPYGLNFAIFRGENDLNSENGGIYESPPDRYVPNSSPANCIIELFCEAD